MNLGVISVRYAKALYKSAQTHCVEDNVYVAMQCLYDNYLQVHQLHLTVTSPMLSKRDKLQVLLAACGEVKIELLERFISLVLESGREQALQFMAASYITLYRKAKNIISGKLITAVPVSNATEKKMKQLVEQRTRGTVEFKTEIDHSIVGGFILEYDTYRLDAGVRTKLQTVLSELSR